MNVRAAWAKGYAGQGVVVTILDDGLETDHPDLKPNYVSCFLILILHLAKIRQNLGDLGIVHNQCNRFLLCSLKELQVLKLVYSKMDAQTNKLRGCLLDSLIDRSIIQHWKTRQLN